MLQSPVLLIDDDPALLQALPETLRLHLPRVTVETCVSAAVALERLQRRTYAAIVSDLRMPGMDGLALLGTLRELRPVTPVVLITAYGGWSVARKAIEAGAFDFIAKPFERDEFIHSIRSALRMYRLRQSVIAREARLGATARRLGLQATVASAGGSEATATSRALIESSHQHLERGTAQSVSSLARILRQVERQESALQRARDRVRHLQEYARHAAWIRAQAVAKVR
jgi:DNA-binding NtrC family response regulator